MAHGYETGRLNLPFVGIPTVAKRPSVADRSAIRADAAILGAPFETGPQHRPGVRHRRGNPVRRAAGPAHVTGITAPGIGNVLSTAREGYAAAQAAGDDFLSVRQVRRLGVEWVIARIPWDARLCIGLDIDGIRPSIAPGTGTPGQGGFLHCEALEIPQAAAKAHQVVGIDLVEAAATTTRPGQPRSWPPGAAEPARRCVHAREVALAPAVRTSIFRACRVA
jgi:arginase family enzyme